MEANRSVQLNFNNSVTQRLFFPYAKKAELEIDIKRDDLIHPVISGNKWRKLYLIFEEAKNNGIESIVTYGGAFSNHLVATACAGELFGFKTTGIVRGDESRPLSNSLALCRWYGMQLKFITREEYRNKVNVSQSYKSLPKTLVIDEGGRDQLAAKGAESIVQELEKQYDYIALPVGTATTLEGICDALDNHQLDTKVLAFSSLKRNETDKNRVKKHLGRINWFDETIFGGYAKFNTELVNFIETTFKNTGILFDPIYQGKMHYRLKQLISEDFFPLQSKILCLHTGGDLGIYSSQMDKIVKGLKERNP